MVVGLTGGIGAGKSVVSKIFSALTIPIYDSDKAAKNLINEDEVLRGQVMAAFGEDIYQDNHLNRSKLAEIVFNDADALNKLNALVHPSVARDFENWSRRQDAPYVIKEAAILFESGANKSCDRTIAVVAPKSIRIERVMKRDASDKNHVESRMANQWSQDRLVELADYTINNEGSEVLIAQVVKIHQDLKKSI